jgi:hypothetical protein
MSQSQEFAKTLESLKLAGFHFLTINKELIVKTLRSLVPLHFNSTFSRTIALVF